MTTKNELTIETITSMYGNDTACKQIIKDHSCSCDSTQEAYNEGVNDGLYMGYKQGMKAGFELGQKSTKNPDTPTELITGEELLDQFNSQSSDISSYVTLTEFIDRELQKAYELGQKAQWISCEERLPNYGDPVLIVVDGKAQPLTFMRDGADDTADWFEPYGGDMGEESFWMRQVTHWMPLPEPPGE